MSIKAFIAASIINVLGADAPAPAVSIMPMPDDIRGLAACGQFEEGIGCRISLNLKTMRDSSRPSNSMRGLPQNKNTVIHELCHVKVFYDAAGPARVLPDRDDLDGGEEHGDDWRACMRTHRGRY